MKLYAFKVVTYLPAVTMAGVFFPLDNQAAMMVEAADTDTYKFDEIIIQKFTPRSNGSWARGVKAIMEKIAPMQERV